MHELSLAEHLVELALEAAPGERVLSLHLRVGTLSCVAPEPLRFCFALAAEGTCLQGARLDIDLESGPEFQLVSLEVA